MGLDAVGERACAPLTDTRGCTVDADRLVDLGISSLGSVRVLDGYRSSAPRKPRSRRSSVISRWSWLRVGISVNAVSAGVVETGALEHFPNRDAMLDMGVRNPAGRLVSPDDVARLVTFLCSPDAEMIRGQTLVVDGGWSLLTTITTGA